jgi:hypothetical protein
MIDNTWVRRTYMVLLLPVVPIGLLVVAVVAGLWAAVEAVWLTAIREARGFCEDWQRPTLLDSLDEHLNKRR